MDATTENPVSPLDYLRPVWRFKWAALAIVIVATAATYVYFDHKPRTYEASTQLYVGQSDINSLLSSQTANPAVDQRSLANQARLVTTPNVAAVVIRRLGLNTTPDSLLEGISVRPDTSADFLTIVAEAPSARLAAQLVNAFAQGYLQVRAAQGQRQVAVQLKIVRLQLARTPKTAGNATARTALRERIQELETAALNPQSVGEQLSTAQPPPSPTAPKPARNAIFAAALAFLLSLILAYGFDRSDRRLRGVDDIEAMFDTAILAAIPRVRNVVPGHGARDEMTPELQEPYHTLRVNLELIRGKRGGKAFLVTSGLPGEGKSTSVRNLALAYRDSGMRVVIVDADLRRPSMASLFDIARGPGTAEVLHGVTEFKDAVQSLSTDTPVWTTGQDHGPSEEPDLTPRRGTGRLDVLVAGDGGENPGLLFYPVAVRQLISELKEHYDIVLVDTPPVLVVSDALALAPEVDGVMLVARIGVTTDASAQRLQRTFESVPQTQVIGAVVNAIPEGHGYASYAYYAQADPAVEKPSANGARGPEAETIDPALRQ